MATKEIVFPSGVNRRLSVRQQAGRRDRYFSPYSMNVRMEDFTGRLRGGSWTPSEPIETAGVVHSGGYVEASPGGAAPGVGGDADCIYRDRFMRPVGRVIWASRQGDYSDWVMSSDVSDTGRPFVIQMAEAGELGDDIVSLIPHKDAYLLVATSSSLWVVQGDPAADGRLQNISRDVGMVGPKAWCRDHLDRYYFLSSHGLYTVSASGEGLQAVSEDVIPIELTGVEDTEEARVVLEYDHETRGVYIHIPNTVSWLYDTERQGFWPFDTEYAGSHVAIGPLLLGDGNTYGRLVQLHGIVASGSVNVIWRVLVADTAEQVCKNAKDAVNTLIQVEKGDIDIEEPGNVQSTGAWLAGVNHRSYPRARGKYMILLLSALSGSWGWEGSACVIEPSGKWR